MKYLLEKFERINRYGLTIPGLALATIVYYQIVQIFFSLTNARAYRVVPDFFVFTQTVFKPEPYETIGYFSGFLIIPLAAWLFAVCVNSLIDKNYIRSEFAQKWPITLVVLALGFLSYKIALHLFWFDAWRETLPRGDLKLQGMLFLSLGFGLATYWRRFDISQFFVWASSLPWKKIRPILFLLLVLLLFSPNFPFDYHHYTDQIAPANDLLHGKQFLNRETGTYSHYGLLNTYFWYAVFSIVPISYQTASLVVMLAAIVWFLAWYFIFREWLKSEAIAVIATLASVVFFTLPAVGLDFIYGAPSATPFHQLGFLAVALLWQRFAKKSELRRRTENWILLLTAVSGFWYVDTGIYVVLATLAAFAFWYIFAAIPMAKKITAILRVCLKFTLAILGLMAAYSLWQFFQFGVLPDWKLLYSAALVYNSGYMMVPLPSHGIYLIFVFVFLVSLGYAIWQAYRDDSKLTELIFPCFLVFFGVQQMLYYITRSHTANLAPRVSIFLIALTAWWWVMLKDKRESKPYVYFAFSGVLAACLIFAGGLGIYKFGTTFGDRDYANVLQNYRAEFVGRPEVYGGNADILDDIAVLKHEYGEIARPAVFHWWDAKIFIDLDKTNYLPIFLFQSILLKSEIDTIVAKVREGKPQYVFIARKDTPGAKGFEMFFDKLDYFYDGIKDLYVVDRQLKTMNVLRLRTVNLYE